MRSDQLPGSTAGEFAFDKTRRSVAGAESGTQIVNGGVGIKLHVPQKYALVFGGARIPLTDSKEFRSEVIVSALYHF